MNGSGRWRVEPAPGCEPVRMSSGATALAHSEWVRLFLGRAIAPAQLTDSRVPPGAAEYLVLGEAPDPSWDDSRRASAAAAASADVESLASAVAAHGALMEAAARDGIVSHPEAFVSTYSVLRCVTVSADPADWCVTDEGLSIVRWGLDLPGAVPVLAWSPDEIRAMGARAMMRQGLGQVAPRAVPDAAAAIAAAQRAISAPPAPAVIRGTEVPPRRTPPAVTTEPPPARTQPVRTPEVRRAAASGVAPPSAQRRSPPANPKPAPPAPPVLSGPRVPAPGLPKWVLPSAAGAALALALIALAWAMSLRTRLRLAEEDRATLELRLQAPKAPDRGAGN